ncbi:predicted permease of the major facilitator superfamily (MFS) [Desulforapulum autotrophicum HRM2]|uniref:Predicted permease of the major facilitator superfamily (MFS) n=1 Tax=Desulforapulum autotrophicum (strain ATCC 43914 / DSM 3382 / VKM B-1955 / HRM2) TaxID=177437 RepID=C0QEF3_DESAH|nr:MFS transporter [Desulforapulum autotrophicum]ACN13270.1 predicted permease of the major facilitator superfamily (MFS) [Desulforapulum autotrophicum HRM2]
MITGSTPAKAAALIAVMCMAQVLGMLGVFAFPAMLPHFMDLWALTNSQAGWISGIYFAGYSIAVPVLTSLTDRIDSRKIYLVSCFVSMIANLGFGIFSQGFWTAIVFRALCGIGLAGTFIPGLKVLIDRLKAPFLPRAISFYTACFGLGLNASFYYAGVIFEWFGWKPVFFIAGACSGFVLLLCLMILVPMPIEKKESSLSGILSALDFRPVWQNSGARTYIIAYMCHMWEMFAARSWMVAFLTFSITLHAGSTPFMAPTTVMAVAGISGMFASILFGELAVKFGRHRIVSAVMTVSGLLSLGIGFMADLPFPALVCLCIAYTFFFQGDSAAIHAGVITAADPDRRGATMALQSLAGFAAASLSPIVVGVVLDLTGGGNSPFSWGLTFATMGLTAFSGLVLLLRVHARNKP